MANKAKRDQEAVDSARAFLQEHLSPGTVVYTLTTHVSYSGLCRGIRTFIVVDGEIVDITRQVSLLTNWRYNHTSRSVSVRGWGMDMEAHTVEVFSRAVGVEDTSSSLRHMSL